MSDYVRCDEGGQHHIHHRPEAIVKKPTEGYHVKRFEKILEIFERENHPHGDSLPSSESICNARASALQKIQKELRGLL